MTQHAARIVPITAGRPVRTPEQRVVYELARIRVAGLREPPPALAHLTRRHD